MTGFLAACARRWLIWLPLALLAGCAGHPAADGGGVYVDTASATAQQGGADKAFSIARAKAYGRCAAQGKEVLQLGGQETTTDLAGAFGAWHNPDGGQSTGGNAFIKYRCVY